MSSLRKLRVLFMLSVVIFILATPSCMRKPDVLKDPDLTRLCPDNYQLVYPASRKDLPDWVLAHILGHSLKKGCVVGVSGLKLSEHESAIQACQRALELKGILVSTEVSSNFNKQTSFDGKSSGVRDPSIKEKAEISLKGAGRLFPNTQKFTIVLKNADGRRFFQSYVLVCDDLNAKKQDRMQTDPEYRIKTKLESKIEQLFYTFEKNYRNTRIPALRKRNEEEKTKLCVVVSSALKPEIISKFREALSLFVVNKDQDFFMSSARCFDYVGKPGDWVRVDQEHLKERNNFLSWWNLVPARVGDYVLSCFPDADGRGVAFYLICHDEEARNSGKILGELQVPDLVNRGNDVRKKPKIRVRKSNDDKSFEMLVSRSDSANIGIDEETTVHIFDAHHAKREIKRIFIEPDSGWVRVPIRSLGMGEYHCNGKWNVLLSSENIAPTRISGDADLGANRYHLTVTGVKNYCRTFRHAMIRTQLSIVSEGCDAHYRLICKLKIEKQLNRIRVESILYKGTRHPQKMPKILYPMAQWSSEYVGHQLDRIAEELVEKCQDFE